MSKTEWFGRNRMKLMLALGVVLALLNLCAPPPSAVVKTTERVATLEATTARANPASPTLADSALPMSSTWDRPILETAHRNPFLSLPVVVPKPPPPVAAVVIAPPPPPAPVAPPLNTRFTGQMTTPDGHKLIFVTQDENTFVLAPGITLPNGYLVEKITANAIEFSHPTFNTMAWLTIPTPPKNETR